MARTTQKKQGATKRGTETRVRIVEAAIEVVAEQGARKFSLDAVAQKAGISKGGLLYNFPTKAALMTAMVARHVDGFASHFQKEQERFASEGHPDPLMRGYLETFRFHLCRKSRPPSGFLAAIAEAPELLDPVREKNAELMQTIRECCKDPQFAMMTFLTLEGIRHGRLFDVDEMSDAETIAVIDRLIALTDRGSAGDTTAHTAPQQV